MDVVGIFPVVNKSDESLLKNKMMPISRRDEALFFPLGRLCL